MLLAHLLHFIEGGGGGSGMGWVERREMEGLRSG